MTDEIRKAFEAQCLSSLIGYTTITGKFEYTDTTTQDQWVVWQRAWQARDAEVAAKDARIAELENDLNSTAASLVTEIFAKVELRNTLDAIRQEVGPEPSGVLTIHSNVYGYYSSDDLKAFSDKLDALFRHYKHAAEHTALKLHEERQRNERLVEAATPLTEWAKSCDWSLPRPLFEKITAICNAVAANAVKGE